MERAQKAAAMREISGAIIDRARRKALANALEDYLRRKIDNFALDDVVCPPGPFVRCYDQMVLEITHQVWYLYDDCSRHYCDLFPEGEDMVCRWIWLLRSSIRFEEIERSSGRPQPSRSKIAKVLRVLLRIVTNDPPKFRGNYYWPCMSAQHWDEVRLKHD